MSIVPSIGHAETAPLSRVLTRIEIGISLPCCKLLLVNNLDRSFLEISI